MCFGELTQESYQAPNEGAFSMVKHVVLNQELHLKQKLPDKSGKVTSPTNAGQLWESNVLRKTALEVMQALGKNNAKKKSVWFDS